jgi:hypothetical protein
MGNTWVVDMSHWDYSEDEAYKFPARTLKFWGYFGSIVAATLASLPPSLPLAFVVADIPVTCRAMGL